MNFEHTPVLMQEMIDFLQPDKNKNFIDLTIGGGGHAEQLLLRTAPGGKLWGVDLDPHAIAASRLRLEQFADRVQLIEGPFDQIVSFVTTYHINLPIQGILLDLGISSFQLADTQRGFSFQEDAPLSMQFGPGAQPTAAHILNTWEEDQIFHILQDFGEERFSRAMAREIIRSRREAPIETTGQLLAIITRVYRGKKKPHKIHFATKTFQALRIAVNQELRRLESVLPQAVQILRPGGRLAVISFHSLEDRIVKHFFKKEATDCICPPQIPECRCGHRKTVRILSKKAVFPAAEEIKRNPRSRSARLRVIEKLPLTE